MGKIYKPDYLRGARLCVMHSLVFFLLAVAPACKRPDEKAYLVWRDKKAVAIVIPEKLLGNKSLLRVVLQGSKGKTGILGSFVKQGDKVIFKPVIPLSPGLAYDIWQADRLIGTVKVPLSAGKPPELIAIYPMQDTVPENLLKFYFQFSSPMRTGEALNHIYLLDKNKDTLRNIFLNLQPELWDSTGKVLTLWLDPGRIKRDLVLNRELGNPLKTAQSYQLVVSHEWKDNRGTALAKTYTKNFAAGARDGEIPDINKWDLHIPKAGSNGPLIINTHEPLDHYLLQESVAVLDDKGKMIYSENVAGDKDKMLKLKLLPGWKAGKYSLIVKAILEDLSGNNLNRVFDRDIRTDGQQHREFYTRVFEVRK